MTRREQRLLGAALTVLALVVDLRLLLLPAWERKRELEQTLIELEEQQDLRLCRIQTAEGMEEAILAQEAALNEASAPSYPDLSTEEMDRIVTDLLLRHDFFPQTLKLEPGRAGHIGSYLSGEGTEKAGEVYDGIPLSVEASAEETAARGRQYLYTARAVFTARGENWLDLLDDIAENYPAIQVSAFQLTGSGTVEGTFLLSMYGP